MDIVYLILRILCFVLASLFMTVYLVAQFWQKLPKTKLEIKTYDYVLWFVVAFTWALGLNSYWGLVAFVPMALWKVLAAWAFEPKRLKGGGRWVEVEWRRFTPKGFQLPPDALAQINKLPANIHFVIPRFVGMIAS